MVGRLAKPEINANLSPAWLAGAWAELGKNWVNKWKAGMNWPIPFHHNEIVDSILVGMKWFIPFRQEKGAAMSKLVDY